MLFRDRREAGRELARALSAYRQREDVIVLALPRGGVPVAFEIAMFLEVPLDLMLVRKLGVPGQEELAMGAIANGDVEALNEDVIRSLSIPKAAIAKVMAEERQELKRRNAAYRGEKPPPDLKGRTVILVDDGMATGANMRAAVQAAKRQAGHVVVAVPLASDSAMDALEAVADEVICLYVPKSFYGVGRFYLDFSQTSDDEVRILLQEVAQMTAQNTMERSYVHGNP